ncbi:efflux RND transporter periplasmic adaptor subunit [Leisingera daeponensis]|uniref:efflux RND transporter periplasmic adaptor subunit n=1 Tax=Leisingera daeponensis TaxID=405746 RepID=UPI001C979730|nr:efflux RND transporter periplasmic adaptor subunit [Leisingera daeponensis]MBY6059012.1 efflux RND transporter periplasmic adaptor subunit [Leisingera daeponensis]
MRGRYAALLLLTLGSGLAIGALGERHYLNASAAGGDAGAEILYWVAPMDANFRRDGPGKSPMGMDLVPVYAGQEPSGDPTEVQLSAAEINAIGVRTALAQVEPLSEQIETVGFVGYNEHLTSHVHTRVEGWIEQFRTIAVGDRVSKGELLFEMFSQKFGSSSADLVRAIEAGDQRIVEVAKRKLRNQGVSQQQIDEVAGSGSPARRLRVYAPQDGVVLSVKAADGMFLQPDTRAVSLTDLSSVWLIVDVFEKDLARLSTEMEAKARFEHLPGRVFEGQVDYIYPELDATTRTLPVRLRFDNTEGLLKPNMFGTVTLSPRQTRSAVTVPNEAIIRTGHSERVILKTGKGTFKPRLITTGLRGTFGDGNRTEVIQGLAPGEEVVASAQFLIDSESALSAGFIRMSPTDVEPARGGGVLVALDPAARLATVQHDELDSLGWPAMVSQFPVRSDLEIGHLTVGQEVAFRAARGADGRLSLIDLGSNDGVVATAMGVIDAVTNDGKLALRHDPIPELGWPAMEMEMSVSGVDQDSIPLGEAVAFDLAKGEDGLYIVVAVRSPDEAKPGSSQPAASAEPPMETAEEGAAPIITAGQIKQIDTAQRKATISHGPIPEIGMPAMTMDFTLADTLDAATLATNRDMTLTFLREDGMTLVLSSAGPASSPIRVLGAINKIDLEASTANITHGPIAEIGMPGMTMNFAISPEMAVEDLKMGQESVLLMTRDASNMLTLVGAAPVQEADQ